MKKTLAVCSIAGFAILGMSTPAYAANDPAQNKPDYWAESPGDCYKVELADDVTSFTLPDLPEGESYYLLVLKAGTVHEAITMGLAEGASYAASSGKDLSHVIVCSHDDPYNPYDPEDPYDPYNP